MRINRLLTPMVLGAGILAGCASTPKDNALLDEAGPVALDREDLQLGGGGHDTLYPLGHVKASRATPTSASSSLISCGGKIGKDA